MNEVLKEHIEILSRGGSVGGARAEALLDALITSEDADGLRSAFEAWNAKGIDEDEIFAFADILRRRCKRVQSQHTDLTDIVGTGGSKAKTFNVSTAAAIVASSAGVPIAKHGNKAATSHSGSADVLEELGIKPIDSVDALEASLERIGICFMFAPFHHRLSPLLAQVRRGLGHPTIFNCVGPLANPAFASHQLIGVWSEDVLEKMAKALKRIGTKRSWIVHGTDGLDEISIATTTKVAEVADNGVRLFEIGPGDLGLPMVDATLIRTRSPAESAAFIEGVVNNDAVDSAAECVVLANAGVAVYLSGRSSDPAEGVRAAREAIRSGAAAKKLQELRDFLTNESIDPS